MTERRIMIAASVPAVLLGLGLRLWTVGTTPLWLDEAYSAYAATHPFGFIWAVVPRYETHPPFYYSLLRLWTLGFGDGLAALRALGLIAGAVTLAVLWLGGRELGRALGWSARRTAWVATVALALGCVSIPLVEMSREVRPYPLLILAYAAALPVLLRIARAGLRVGVYALYLVLLLLVLWLHNLGVLFGAAMGLALLVAAWPATRREWAELVGGHVAVGLGYLPALAILRDQAPTWIGSTWLVVDWGLVPDRLGALYAVPGWQGAAGMVLVGLAVWWVAACPDRSAPAALPPSPAGGRGTGAQRQGEGTVALMLLILALLPVLLSLAISAAVAPVFIARTMTPVAAPALLLLAMGACAWDDWRRWLGWIGAGMVAANMLAVDLQARAAEPMQDWYGAVAWLGARTRPGDVVLAYPNEGALPLERALRDKGVTLPVRPVPGPVPSFAKGGEWYPTGSRGVVALPERELAAVAAGVRRAPTVWLLRLGPGMYDKGDAFLRVLRRERDLTARRVDGAIDVAGLSARSRPALGRSRR